MSCYPGKPLEGELKGTVSWEKNWFYAHNNRLWFLKRLLEGICSIRTSITREATDFKTIRTTYKWRWINITGFENIYFTCDCPFKDWVEGAEHGVIYLSFGSMMKASLMPESRRKLFVKVMKKLTEEKSRIHHNLTHRKQSKMCPRLRSYC